LIISGQSLYFVYPIDDRVIDKTRDTNLESVGDRLVDVFKKNAVEPHEIKNNNNERIFEVYEIKNDDGQALR